jgi:hypothetical protein
MVSMIIITTVVQCRSIVSMMIVATGTSTVDGIDDRIVVAVASIRTGLLLVLLRFETVDLIRTGLLLLLLRLEIVQYRSIVSMMILSMESITAGTGDGIDDP